MGCARGVRGGLFVETRRRSGGWESNKGKGGE